MFVVYIIWKGMDIYLCQTPVKTNKSVLEYFGRILIWLVVVNQEKGKLDREV